MLSFDLTPFNAARIVSYAKDTDMSINPEILRLAEQYEKDSVTTTLKGFKDKLTTQQQNAVYFLQKRFGNALLADDDRLCNIVSSLYFMYKHRLFPCIIITSKEEKIRWYKEIKDKISGKISVNVIGSTNSHEIPPSDFSTNPKKNKDIYILDYNCLASRVNAFSRDVLNHFNFQYAIFDQCHLIPSSSYKSKREKAVRELIEGYYNNGISSTTFISNTPLGHNPLDLQILISALFDEKDLSAYKSNKQSLLDVVGFLYRNFCVTRSVTVGNWRTIRVFKKAKNIENLREMFQKYIFRVNAKSQERIHQIIPFNTAKDPKKYVQWITDFSNTVNESIVVFVSKKYARKLLSTFTNFGISVVTGKELDVVNRKKPKIIVLTQDDLPNDERKINSKYIIFYNCPQHFYLYENCMSCTNASDTQAVYFLLSYLGSTSDKKDLCRLYESAKVCSTFLDKTCALVTDLSTEPLILT